MIDTHVHLLDSGRYPYPPGSSGYVPGPNESGTLDDLLNEMDRNGIDAAVLVAASVYGGDNASMLDAVAEFPGRFRVIAGVAPGDIHAIGRLAETPGVRGIRLNLTDDNALTTSPQVTLQMNAALEAGMCVTIQAAPCVAERVLGEAGSGDVILDHLGRPDLEGGLDTLHKLATRHETWLKLSGGFRIAGGGWPNSSALIEDAVAAFPANRLIWGSDWPFINVSGQRPGYATCLEWGRSLTDADLVINAKNLFWSQA